MLGFLRANHPTFGYIPQGALNMVKEFGLMVFMAGVGLSAGAGINNGLGAVGGQMLAAGLIVSLVPVVICFLFGAYVLRMNRAMLFGAMMGARTCAPAMEIISDTARSNIPALGYAGTYAIANVLAYPCRDAHRDHLARATIIFEKKAVTGRTFSQGIKS
ncbi:hypothetical protein LNQ52_30650 [Klebsiella pneumoniae subsp. pneumoniae]|nr:hypothetical protein [Klebsiella pneumoniae subsp. pneumoniae]